MYGSITFTLTLGYGGECGGITVPPFNDEGAFMIFEDASYVKFDDGSFATFE